jgi:hypothetical protein
MLQSSKPGSLRNVLPGTDGVLADQFFAVEQSSYRYNMVVREVERSVE